MKTLTKSMTATVSVFLLSMLPVIVNGDSLADKRADTPVETWNSQEMELERAILTGQVEPTAAGSASVQHQPDSMMHEPMHSSGDMEHGVEQYRRASDYKRETFGSN
jgi:hypothetical protein